MAIVGSIIELGIVVPVLDKSFPNCWATAKDGNKLTAQT